VIVALEADKFTSWSDAQFAPEEQFLAALKAIDGITQIETQNYTLTPL
jgi:hypothetical protein